MSRARRARSGSGGGGASSSSSSASLDRADVGAWEAAMNTAKERASSAEMRAAAAHERASDMERRLRDAEARLRRMRDDDATRTEPAVNTSSSQQPETKRPPRSTAEKTRASAPPGYAAPRERDRVDAAENARSDPTVTHLAERLRAAERRAEKRAADLEERLKCVLTQTCFSPTSQFQHLIAPPFS